MQKLYKFSPFFFLHIENFQLLKAFFRYPGFAAVEIMVGKLPEFFRIGESYTKIFKFCIAKRVHFLICMDHLHAKLLIPALLFHDLAKKLIKIGDLYIKTASRKIDCHRSFPVKKQVMLTVIPMADPSLPYALSVQSM